MTLVAVKFVIINMVHGIVTFDAVVEEVADDLGVSAEARVVDRRAREVVPRVRVHSLLHELLHLEQNILCKYIIIHDLYSLSEGCVILQKLSLRNINRINFKFMLQIGPWI
jgi:hypothetical protein